MPSAIHYLDDTIILNESDHQFIAFYASFFAVEVLDTDAYLTGNPPRFRPVAPSPYVLTRYHQLYIFFYDQLDAIMEAPDANQQ